MEAAVAAAAAAGVPLIVATGKAIGPWTRRILPRLATTMPQIFIQGLLIRDLEEGIIFQRLIDEDLLREAVEFAEQHELSLTAYSGGDRIVCHTTDEHTSRLIFYGEPIPEAIGKNFSLSFFLSHFDLRKGLLYLSSFKENTTHYPSTTHTHLSFTQFTKFAK